MFAIGSYVSQIKLILLFGEELSSNRIRLHVWTPVMYNKGDILIYMTEDLNWNWNIASDRFCDVLEGYVAPDIYLFIVPLKVIIDQCGCQDDANIDIRERVRGF